MATEEALEPISCIAGADLSSYQYRWVKYDSSNPARVVLAGEGDNPIGILQDKPAAAGRACRVAKGGVSKMYCGGNITSGAGVGVMANGAGSAVGSSDDRQLALAQETGAAGRIIAVLIDKRGLT